MSPIFSAHIQDGELPDPSIHTDQPGAQDLIREFALTCRDNQLPFRISYPQRGRFRYPTAASFTSR
jgi:hypothetical protein